MMAKVEADASARAAVRDIGWVTVKRLTLYYLFAGAVLLTLSALLPESEVARPQAVQLPGNLSGVVEWFREEMALFPRGAPAWVDALFQMIAALVLVLPFAFVYVRTRTRVKFDHSLVQTVIVLPIVVTAILIVVQDSLALAFSLAGIVAAVRFRNNLKESGDAVYIFGSIGLGFATGIHAVSVAAVLSVVFVVVELALWKFNFSAEFEQTFARLCLPSGADLATLRAAGEPAATAGGDAGNGRKGMADDDGEERSSLLRIYVDRVEEARGPIEMVLARDAKRWHLEQVTTQPGQVPILAYRIRPRKRVGLEGLRQNLLREGAPHVVAADDGVTN